MSSPWIKALRSVALDVPDLPLAEDFYTRVWHLEVVARTDDAIFFRGTGADHHLLSVHQAERLAIRNVTLRARHPGVLERVSQAVVEAGGRILQPLDQIDEPGGGQGLTFCDPSGRVLRVVYGDRCHTDTQEVADRPMRLAHVVLNSRNVEQSQRFFESSLKFKLADRTRIMAFMNCDNDHHSIALGDAENDALNHIAFLMPDIDSVMRGGGRMRDASHPIEWGPGRHGPGNNAFNYFIGPFGEVIEYTAEVEQIDETYRPGTPEDWVWPPGRLDQWGISQPPSAALKDAQKSVFFINIPNGQA
ncbi:VOC family protein [Marinobacterium sp. D7]|uniref:VOC family protein n=1 Tax=Marinobacterium ramblicola TaxID=2849041 RepID=UPI001C2DCDC2|nr:VOC family protein [Marinobacterium ramblicola]MBV1788701.1 VOC family protein [Marinobacterium ramblicola]